MKRMSRSCDRILSPGVCGFVDFNSIQYFLSYIRCDVYFIHLCVGGSRYAV